MQISSDVPYLAIDVTVRHPGLIFFFFSFFAEMFHFKSWMVQVSVQLLSEVFHFTKFPVIKRNCAGFEIIKRGFPTPSPWVFPNWESVKHWERFS